jgi:septum formation protein
MTTAGLPCPLMLGSASFTRTLILKQMGIDFQIVVRPIDGKCLGDRLEDAPHDLMLNLAQAKMEHLVQEIKAGRCQEELSSYEKDRSWIVLTGDQVVMCKVFIKKNRSRSKKRSILSPGMQRARPVLSVRMS